MIPQSIYTTLFSYTFDFLFPFSFFTHSILGCILFSFFLRAAAATSELYTMERYRDEIYLVVISSDLLDNTIDWRDSPDLLRELLES